MIAAAPSTTTSGALRALGARQAQTGVRLLMAGAGLQHLRWSTDPDAPAARALSDGEVRLHIQRVELRACDLQGLRTRCAGPAGARRNAWQVAAGIGIAVVDESRSAACGVGDIVKGPLPISTHCVLRVLAADAHGVVARWDFDDGTKPERYAWCAGPLLAPAVTGMDAVARAVAAVRDLGHDATAVTALSLAATGSS